MLFLFLTHGGLFCRVGKSILQFPDTGTSQYRWILEHFYCTSIAWKCGIYVLRTCWCNSEAYNNGTPKLSIVLSNTMYQYLGPQVYFFCRVAQYTQGNYATVGSAIVAIAIVGRGGWVAI